MSNYSENTSQVRVDLFKTSGKWAYTVELDMSGHYTKPTVDSVRDAFKERYGNQYQGLTAVCLEPYCEYVFPVMFLIQ